MPTESHFVNIKLFTKNPEENFDVKQLIPVFHRWIQQQKLQGLLIDVADYSHVHHGPGVMLVTLDANYAADLEDGKLGLLYAGKRSIRGSLQEQIQQAFFAVWQAASLIEQEKQLGLQFDLGQILVRIHDRLHYPNTDNAANQAKPIVHSALQTLIGQQVEIQALPLSGQPLSFELRLSAPPASASELKLNP